MSVAAWAAGVLARRPFNALAQVTNRCNMRCPFCDFWPNGAPKEELSAAEWARVARELAGLGTFLVSVEGGEPLVRPDLPEIIQGFRAAGHLPILYTNGATSKHIADNRYRYRLLSRLPLWYARYKPGIKGSFPMGN